MNKHIDTETQAILTEGEHYKALVDSEGWKLAHASLQDRIIDLQMIGNVTGQTAEEKVRDMEARMMASNILFQWLQDVHGRVQQFEANKNLAPQDPIISRDDS
ncbi:MAG TPA: hypothetical protein VN039_01820 [Nitrospira sp.]|nr:hypothetical protein [Nitrospira sp.]